MQRLTEATAQAQTKRRRKAKPIRHADDVERFYRVQLRSLVRAMARRVDELVVPVIKAERDDYIEDAAPTFDDWSDRVTTALDVAAGEFLSASMEAQFRRLASAVVERAEQTTTQRLIDSVKGAVGVDLRPILSERGMADYINAATQQNVELITSLPNEYFKRIRTTVYQGMMDGVHPSALVDQIREDTGVSRRRAELLARDQTSKIVSQVTEKRQRQAGIEYYQSIDAGDIRVSGRPGGRYPNARISCWGIARRDIGFGPGVYRLDEGASWAGETGLHPGRHHPLCRCVAAPRFEWEVEGD